MDASLRMNLSDALSDALDRQILVGDRRAFQRNKSCEPQCLCRDDLRALSQSIRLWTGGWKICVDRGAIIRMVVGSATYGHMAAQFRSNNAGDRAALEDLMAVTAGVKVSAHVPAVASSKQNAVIRLGSRRDAVAPLWEGVTLIPDEITKASSGEIVVTAVMLFAMKILRSDGFYKQQAQHA